MKIYWVFLCFCIRTGMAQEAGSYSGTVTAEKIPVVGVTVHIQGSDRKTVTDSLGHFFFSHLPAGNYHLLISGIGYRKRVQQVRVPGEGIFQLIPLQDELDQVVVTAVVGNALLKKTPVAITVVSQKEMSRAMGSNAIDGLLKFVPGISAITTGPNISKPFIRGLGYNRVLTLYDGLRQEGQQWGDEHGIEVDPYSIARAEIVKGPASLFYGSDAIAGVVNLVPGLPAGTDGKIKGDFITEYHSNNHTRSIAGGAYAHKHKISWNIRGSVRTASDYRNAVDGYVYNTGFSEKNALLMLGWENRKTQHFLRFTLYDNQQEIPDGSRDSLTRSFTYQIAEADKDDIRNRPLVPAEQFTSRDIADLHQHIEHYRIYHKGKFQLGRGELTTLLGWQQNTRREYNHPTAVTQAGLFVSLQTLNYEARLLFPEWAGIGFTYGVNGMYQSNTNKDATDFPIPDYTLFDIGNFLLAKKEFRKTIVTGGIRWDNRLVNWPDFYTREDAATGFPRQLRSTDTSGAVLNFPAYRKHFNGFSGSMGLVHSFSEWITLKTNLATGYRCPSVPETGSDGLDPGAHIYYIGNRHAEPETNWQADLGLSLNRTNWDAGAELFYNRINRYIFLRKLFSANGQPLEIVPGNFTYQYQQGAAEIYGVEYHISFHPIAIPWLSVLHTVSMIRGNNQDAVSLRLSGDDARYLPMIPPAKTGTRIKAQWPQKKGILAEPWLQAELETHATQNRFYAVDNTETTTPGYTLLHVGAGFVIRNKKEKNVCQVFLNINNLLNRAYQSHQNRLKYFEYYNSSPTGTSGIYNMGRNCSVKMVVNW